VDLEREFIRTTKTGSKISLANVAVMALVAKSLGDKFPDVPMLCEEEVELILTDDKFASTVASFLNDFGLIEGATPELLLQWLSHAKTYQTASKPPTRYWTLMPIDTTEEFLQTRQFCTSLALIEDGQPVAGFITCPVIPFDHYSRSGDHPSGVPMFFAVKDQGSWTQLILTEREDGVYQGKWRLKGKPLRLDVGQKIKREQDGLYDFLGTDQLKITMGWRLREDIFVDAERIAKILGSEFPKFDMTSSSIKYCYLARGEADIVWYLANGLYDKERSNLERACHHAAGSLIAAESGASIGDLEGKPIVWDGPVLSSNRGFAATDPGKVPLMGLVRAIEQATDTSQDLYEKRCEKRKEVNKILSQVFNNLEKFAETEEEMRGAKMAKERGMEVLKSDEEMEEITKTAINRENPILGESATPDAAFDGSAFSPIGT